jgi:hypothetical protein
MEEFYLPPQMLYQDAHGLALEEFLVIDLRHRHNSVQAVLRPKVVVQAEHQASNIYSLIVIFIENALLDTVVQHRRLIGLECIRPLAFDRTKPWDLLEVESHRLLDAKVQESCGDGRIDPVEEKREDDRAELFHKVRELERREGKSGILKVLHQVSHLEISDGVVHGLVGIGVVDGGPAIGVDLKGNFEIRVRDGGEELGIKDGHEVQDVPAVRVYVDALVGYEDVPNIERLGESSKEQVKFEEAVETVGIELFLAKTAGYRIEEVRDVDILD